MATEEQTPVTTVTPLQEAAAKYEAFYITYATNLNKFLTKGTASAAARSRKALSEASKFTKKLRKELQTARKEKTAEKRAAKAAKPAA
jgi:hypothetical protein